MPRLALLTACLCLGTATPASADLVVQRVPGADAADLRDRAGVESAGAVTGLPGVEVVVADDGRQRRALEALRDDPAVEWAEPVRERSIAAEPLQPSQWGLVNTGQLVWNVPGTAGADIAAGSAWLLSRGADTTIAVVDTGADLGHPDLTTRVTGNPGERGSGRESNGADDDGNGFIDDWRGWDFAGDDNLPADQHGHGTHVAGTAVAAENGAGVVGVAPDADLIVLQALAADGTGYSTDVASAFDYAGELGVEIVNASLGSEMATQVERAAIAAHPKTLYVVAAGNGGPDGIGDDVDSRPTYPCAYDEPNVLCVGASTQDDELGEFSNYGAESVDVIAPGVNIVSSHPRTLPSDWTTVYGGPPGFEILDGTSMASPHAAGVAALVSALHPTWSPTRLRQALVASSDPVPALAGSSASDGRLDAAAALAWTTTEPDPEPEPEPEPEPLPLPLLPPPPPALAAPAGPPTVTNLLVFGRPRACGRRSCPATAAALTFNTSHAGTVTLKLERRRCRGKRNCRYVRTGTSRHRVGAGSQRLSFAGLRLYRGTWRATLAGARVVFLVR